MSLIGLVLFGGLEASCLEIVGGEFSGETDISSWSSSTFRFLEAMAIWDAERGVGQRAASR